MYHAGEGGDLDIVRLQRMTVCTEVEVFERQRNSAAKGCFIDFPCRARVCSSVYLLSAIPCGLQPTGFTRDWMHLVACEMTLCALRWSVYPHTDVEELKVGTFLATLQEP